MWMMLPPPRWRIGSVASLVSTKAPTRLMRSTSAKSAAEISVSGDWSRTAAELTTTSTPPHSLRAAATSSRHVALEPRVARDRHRGPARALDRARDLPQRLRPSPEDGHARALPREPLARWPGRSRCRPRPRGPPCRQARPPGLPTALAIRPIGRAEALHGAGAAARRPRGAPGRAEVHQGLVVVVGSPARHAARPARSHMAFWPRSWASRRGPRNTRPSTRRTLVSTMGTARPYAKQSRRARGVAADAAHPPQRPGVVGQPPAVARHRLARDPVQVERADVVPERVPEAPDVVGRRARQGLERRVAFEELVVFGHDPLHLRLLEHDLRDEDVVRVPGAAPRQVAPVAAVPLQQAAAEARAGPGIGRGGGRHGGHCVRVGREPQVDRRRSRDNNEPHARPGRRVPRRPPRRSPVRPLRARKSHRDRTRSARVPPGHAHQRRQGPPAGPGGPRRVPRRSRQGHGAARRLRDRRSGAARAAREPHREDAPDHRPLSDLGEGLLRVGGRRVRHPVGAGARRAHACSRALAGVAAGPRALCAPRGGDRRARRYA